jgi:hypothetical protein
MIWPRSMSMAMLPLVRPTAQVSSVPAGTARRQHSGPVGTCLFHLSISGITKPLIARLARSGSSPPRG